MTRFEKVFFGVGIIIVELLVQSYFSHLQFGVENTGISFGILPGYASWGATATILVLILKYNNKILDHLGWWLVAVGGIANTTSRLINGYVFDYLPFGQYLCNYLGINCDRGGSYLWIDSADIMISVGAVIVIAEIVRNYWNERNSNSVGKRKVIGNK